MRRIRKNPPRKTLPGPYIETIRRQLADPNERLGAALEMGEWARDLCIVMGVSLDTAFYVGGEFASGLLKEWSEDATEKEGGEPSYLSEEVVRAGGESSNQAGDALSQRRTEKISQKGPAYHPYA